MYRYCISHRRHPCFGWLWACTPVVTILSHVACHADAGMAVSLTSRTNDCSYWFVQLGWGLYLFFVSLPRTVEQKYPRNFIISLSMHFSRLIDQRPILPGCLHQFRRHSGLSCRNHWNSVCFYLSAGFLVLVLCRKKVFRPPCRQHGQAREESSASPDCTCWKP